MLWEPDRPHLGGHKPAERAFRRSIWAKATRPIPAIQGPIYGAISPLDRRSKSAKCFEYAVTTGERQDDTH